MNTVAEAAITGADTAAAASEQGWYLYGITRRRVHAVVPIDTDAAGSGGGAPLRLLEYGELAAVVRPVSLADFNQAALQERLRSMADVEALVRSHHRVIEAVHAQQPILPAKFGMVYTRPAEIVAALELGHARLLQQLQELDGCDEWAVHLYADVSRVRDGAATDPAIARLREEHAAARPGRAYFLERQLNAALETATQDALLTLAQDAFDAVATAAVAGQLSAAGTEADPGGEAEILRATFLVRRDRVDDFEAAVQGSTTIEGVRCECSGPWPPYSFAAGEDEVAA